MGDNTIVDGMILQRSIRNFSNPQNSCGNWACANNVYQALFSPAPTRAWERGYCCLLSIQPFRFRFVRRFRLRLCSVYTPLWRRPLVTFEPTICKLQRLPESSWRKWKPYGYKAIHVWLANVSCQWLFIVSLLRFSGPGLAACSQRYWMSECGLRLNGLVRMCWRVSVAIGDESG